MILHRSSYHKIRLYLKKWWCSPLNIGVNPKPTQSNPLTRPHHYRSGIVTYTRRWIQSSQMLKGTTPGYQSFNLFHNSIPQSGQLIKEQEILQSWDLLTTLPWEWIAAISRSIQLILMLKITRWLIFKVMKNSPSSLQTTKNTLVWNKFPLKRHKWVLHHKGEYLRNQL